MRTILIVIILLLVTFNILRVTEMTSIHEFGVKPENSFEQNKVNLQKAIDGASESKYNVFARINKHPNSSIYENVGFVLHYLKLPMRMQKNEKSGISYI